MPTVSPYSPIQQSGVRAMNPADVIITARVPTAADADFFIGTQWIRLNNAVYTLVGKPLGVANWVVSAVAGSLDTLTDGVGGTATPVAANIVMTSTANQVTTTAAADTVTFSIPAVFIAPGSIASTTTLAVGTDATVAGALDVTGATTVTDITASTTLDVVGASTLAATTIVGALTQTGGAVNIGHDNAANAINIGGGTVARAITIGADAALHTVYIGSASAGAITLESAAAITLNADLSSLITVTGAAETLTLFGDGGSIIITASEAAGDAILINATDAAGGVQVRAGTGGILIGNEADTTTISVGDFAPTANRTITIGGGTVITAATTNLIDIAPDGATTNANSISTVNINTGTVAIGQSLTNVASGAVTSGTHTVAIATGAVAAGASTTNIMTGAMTAGSTVALNVLTGTGTKIANIGNADALTTLNIDAITLINDSVNAATSINTGTSTGAVAIGNALSGAVTVDSVSTVEINSAGGAISVGNDANNFAINIGTLGTRPITVGSAAATIVLTSGGGDMTVTGTVKRIGAEFLYASGDEVIFQSNPLCQIGNGTFAVPAGATGEVDRLLFQEGIIMEQFIIGAGQTILAPAMDANGLLASLDLTATEGVEYNFGAVRLNSRHAFTIGTSPAFFFELRFRINDMDGADPYIFGFRKSAANNAVWTDYTDYATMGMLATGSATNIVLNTELNAGGTVTTNTNDLWGGDGAINTLTVKVSSAGVVTYLVNGVAPTATAAFTFDTPDVVVPFIHIVHSASPTAVNLISYKIGYQA